MKTILVVLSAGLVLLMIQSFTEPQPKLIQGLSASELSVLSENQLEYYNFLSNFGYRVHAEMKSTDLPLLSSVIKPQFSNSLNYLEISQENFNPFVFSTGIPNNHLFFQVDGTTKMVQLYSASFCEHLYARHQTNLRNAKK